METYSVRIRLEDGQPVAYIERAGANPGDGIRIAPGQAWAVEQGASHLNLFAVCNESGMSRGDTFKRVK